MISRTLLSPRFLLPVLFAPLGLAVFARAQAPGSTPPPKPELRAFAAAEGRWAWIKATGDQSELFLGAPSTSGRSRAKGSGWTEAALDGSTVWMLARNSRGGTLMSLPIEGETPPAEVLQIEDQPGALLAHDGQLYWLELSQAADPGLAFVPPLGARLRLRCREASGTVRTLMERPAVDGAALGTGDLVAVAGGQLYLRLHSASGTELLTVPLAGGAATRIAGESGRHDAVLSNGVLYWTAPSEEAMPESGIRSLRRLKAEGVPETVADWLPGLGNLAAADEGLRFAGAGDLYSLPDRLGSPTFLRKIDWGSVVSDGHSLVILGTDQPQLLSARSPRP